MQSGCKSEDNITVYKIKKNDSLMKKSFEQQTDLSPLNWMAPQNWIEKKPTDFRIASYDVPMPNGEIVDVSISMFPGDAGGIEQNVNRWRRQLNLKPQTKDVILENAKQEFNVLGNYLMIHLKNDLTKQSILGSIIPHSNNETIIQTIFIKMTGSTLALNELDYEFNIFCKSISLKNEKYY